MPDSYKVLKSDSAESLEQRINDAVADGWAVHTFSADSALMTRNDDPPAEMQVF